MNRLLAGVLILAAVAAGCSTVPSTDIAKSAVSNAVQAWASAFNTCDADRIAALYDREAVLWGTVATTLIASPAGVHQYFARACSSKPPPSVSIGNQNIRVYGDTANSSGTYAFSFGPEDKRRTIQARFSFTFRLSDGRWLIVDHHSSMLPAPPR